MHFLVIHKQTDTHTDEHIHVLLRKINHNYNIMTECGCYDIGLLYAQIKPQLNPSV